MILKKFLNVLVNNKLYLVALFILGWMMVLGFSSTPVSANGPCVGSNKNWFNRNEQCGYFTNGYDAGHGDVLFEGGLDASNINTKDEFINFINAKLNSGNIRHSRGAAFIVLTMLGIDADDNGSTVENAKNSINSWKSVVNNSTIQPHYWAHYDYNTFWQNAGGDQNDNDVAGYAEADTVDSFAFINPSNGNVWYKIKRSCGNPIGIPKITTFKPVPKSSVKPGNPGDPGSYEQKITLNKGDRFTFRHSVTNDGQLNFNGQTKVDWTQNPYGWGNQSSKNVSINAGNTYSETLSYTIPNTATNGQTICQRIYVWPKTGTDNGNKYSSQACVTVSVLPEPTLGIVSAIDHDSIINKLAPAVEWVNAGDSATFKHLFYKNNDAGKTWNVDVLASNGDWLTTVWPRGFPDPWTKLDVDADGNQLRGDARTINFPTREVYCEWADYARLSGTDPKPTGSSLSNNGAFIEGKWAPQGVCAEVHGYNTVASSALDSTASITLVPPGSGTVPISFKHTIGNRNIGPLGGGATNYVGGDVIGYSDNGINDALYYRIPSGADKTLPSFGPYNAEPGLHCQQMYYWPLADNNSGVGLTDKACVNVIDPSSSVPPTVSYEKGTGAFNISGAAFAINNGNACPADTISIPYYVKVNGVDIANTSFTYGGGNCNVIQPTVTISSVLANSLDNLPPGSSGIKYCIKISNEPESCGIIDVYEVPFTRFYGNEVYSTNDSIKFNSRTNNPSSSFNGQGSVAQYAALASNSIVLDTAAYRSGAPSPPDGLDSPNSLLPKKSSSVYTDVKNSLPTTCTAIPSGNSFASQASGCYTLNGSNHFGGAEIPILGTGDGFGLGANNYTNKQITIVNNTDNMFMIAGDVQTDNQGVLLIVSKGDIVIDNNVKRVDAILITNGNIYTCGFAGYGPARQMPQNLIDENCRVPLTVNGALSAKTIDFRRVGGSRYLNSAPGDEQQNCNISKGIKNCGERGDMPFNTGKTAEIINFPAYLYWANPYLKDESKNGAKVDAIFIAPPRQ